MEIWLVYFGIAALFVACGPLITLVHELGHALVARALSGQPVEVFVGSHGDVGNSLRVPLGPRSKLYVCYRLGHLSGGMCQLVQPLTGYSAMLMVLAGPVLPALLSAALAWWAFYTDANDLLRVWSMVMVVSSGVSLLWNLRNRTTPVVLFDGTHTYNDGALLRAYWQLRHLPGAYLRALIDFDKADFAAAAPALVQHLELAHDQEDNIRRAVVALMQVADHEQARSVLHRYKAQLVYTAADWINEGVLYAKLNELRESLECYEQALALEPDNWLALNNRGYTRIRTEHYTDSVADFRQALALHPDFAYAHANLGLALLMLGAPEEALSHIQQSLALDDTNAYAYRNLGIYYLQRGELSAARQHLDQAAQLDPQTDLLADYQRQLQLAEDQIEATSRVR